MRKTLASLLLIFCAFTSTAQLQMLKLIGKNSKDFGIGYGGFLTAGYQLTPGAEITLEIAANLFPEKNSAYYGWGTFPLKLGYRYTFNKLGYGWYVHPQAGYNLLGIDPLDEEFTGIVLGTGAGYLFKTSGKIQFDLGLVYEAAAHKGGWPQYLALRLSHNITFGKKRFAEDE